MPDTFRTKLATWIKAQTEENQKCFVRVRDGHILCNICNRSFNCNIKSQLDQHIDTDIHKRSLKRNDAARQVQLESSNAPRAFNDELCDAFLAADIPLEKIENPVLKCFLEKYINRPIPSAWTLRNKCVEFSYDKVIEGIRDELKDKFIWMAVDESTDRCGRFVANVIVGALDDNESKPHIIMCKELETANNVTVSHLVMDALAFLWPGKEQGGISRQFAVFLSDAAPYMIKTGSNLKVTYPNLIHVTCLAHGIHRVAEAIRSNYKDLDRLIGCIKAVFKKSPHRIREYHKALPGVPLPPEPVITRWGTWIEAVCFLSSHFHEITNVINSFEANEAECVKKAQSLLAKESVRNKTVDVTTNFGFLSALITKLETRNLKLCDSVDIVNECRQKINDCDSRIKDKISTKLSQVLEKNQGFKTMADVVNIFKGENVSTGRDTALLSSLKFCPMTSVELERSFSMAKALLSDRRTSFKIENFEK